MDEFPTTVLIEPIGEIDFPFIGWVPTAKGRLSFRHVGDTKHPRICTYANLYGTDRTRLIAAAQKRNLSDLLFAPISEHFLKVSGKFWFTLACRSHDEDELGLDSLSGEVCIFMPDSWPQHSVKLLSLISDMNDKRLQYGAEQSAQSAFERFNVLAASKSNFLVSFRLKRNGIVEFGAPRFKDNDLRKASEADATQRGVAFSRWIADQAYFFLRDLCHFHQHHAPTTDTILTLQEQSAAHRDWRNCILYSLHHYVIRARRSNRVEDLHKAIGVLAYAKAFKAVCDLIAPNGKADLATLQNDAIGQSINAKAAEIASINLVDAQTTTIALTNRGAFLTVFAISFAAVTGLFQALFANRIREVRPYVSLLEMHPVAAVTIAGIVLLLGMIYFSESIARRRKKRSLNNTFWWRDILAVVRAPKAVSVLLMTLSAIIVFMMIWLSVNYP